MNIIAQRGLDDFIIETNGKTVLVDTFDKYYKIYRTPEILYKGGYWDDPNPSKEQIDLITDIIKELL